MGKFYSVSKLNSNGGSRTRCGMVVGVAPVHTGSLYRKFGFTGRVHGHLLVL